MEENKSLRELMQQVHFDSIANIVSKRRIMLKSIKLSALLHS